MGQCDCTSDIKQLLGKMDIIQNSVAANNESYQGKLSLTTTRYNVISFVPAGKVGPKEGGWVSSEK